MGDVAVTELVDLNATKVAGVSTPANGTPFLLLKSADAEQCSTCKGSGKIREGNMTCPTCKGSGKVAKSSSSEADEFEEETTDEAAKAAFCGDMGCVVCVAKGLAVKAKLSGKERKELPKSSFAYVDKKGKGHLPVHDESHTKAALGRFSQTDFSGADDPAAAKKSAARKIVSAAKKHGIEVDSGSTVAEAAKKGAVQDALGGAGTPQAAGHLAGGKSGMSGSLTTGALKSPPADSSQTLGGESPFVITIEGSVVDQPIPATTDGLGILNPSVVGKAAAVASLWGALEQIEEQRRAIKEGGSMSLSNDAGTPGSFPWESFDAATLEQVAHCLAGCCAALDCIAQRERIEAIEGDVSDFKDAWDIEEAENALQFALGVAARLSFHEALAGEAAKSADPDWAAKVGRVLSGTNHEHLEAARDHLNAVISGAKRKDSAGESEEDDIMATVTKAELAEMIQAGALEAARTLKKEEKKAAKKARKAAEAAAKEAPNNGGDIGSGGIKPTGTTDADDVNGIPSGGSVDGQYVNKGEAETETDKLVKGIGDKLDSFAKELDSVKDLVSKIAKRPRPGGPSLTGLVPAGEGRVEGGDAAKSGGSDDDAEIARLESALKEAKGVDTDGLVMQLNHARLRRFYDTGRKS